VSPAASAADLTVGIDLSSESAALSASQVVPVSAGPRPDSDRDEASPQ
jgi:hypothetical protein